MSGGAGRHVRDLIKNLDQKRFELYCIYSTQRVDDNFYEEIAELKKHATLFECPDIVREINPSKDLKAYRFISQKIKELNPEVVHCNSSKAGVLGRLAAKRRRVKKVYYTPHAYSFFAPEFSNKKKFVFVSIERILSKVATTKTFCVSDSEKEQALLNKIAADSEIEVIYNGIRPQTPENYLKIREFLNLPLEAVIIGNNARMSEQKNPWLFIEIAQEIVKENALYHFVWVGDGPLFESVKGFVEQQGLTRNIHLLGNRSDSEFIVANYDIFLITSLYEGLPYALIEAMRAGVPIVGKKVVGVKEMIIEDYNGRFFNEVSEISSIFNTVQQKKIFCHNSLATFHEKYTMDQMIERIEEQYLLVN